MTLIVLGDSNTDFALAGPNESQHRWSYVLARLLGVLEINYAIAGTSLAQTGNYANGVNRAVLACDSIRSVQSLGYNPIISRFLGNKPIVAMMYGTNDAVLNIPPAHYNRDIYAIVDCFIQSGCERERIILMPALWTAITALNSAIEPYRAFTRQCAMDYGVQLFDAYNWSANQSGFFLPDGAHLNIHGQYALGHAIYNTLNLRR
jgi:lysophospholipase L1-like esterase